MLLVAKSYRFHNIFGPEGTWDGGKEKAPAAMCRKVAQTPIGGEMEMWGDGEQTRSFCYVDDLVKGITAMMQSPAGFCGPVNLGNPDEFTIRELAEMVLELTGSGSKLVYKKLPADDPVRRKPDISLAKEKLSWEPSVPLKEGLIKTIAYFDRLLSE